MNVIFSSASLLVSVECLTIFCYTNSYLVFLCFSDNRHSRRSEAIPRVVSSDHKISQAKE